LHPKTKDEGEGRLGDAGVEEEGSASDRRKILEAILNECRSVAE